MSAYRCVYCVDVLAYDGPGLLVLRIAHQGAEVVLRWHVKCAEVDELHAELAEADARPLSAEADEAFILAYLKLVRRAEEAVGGWCSSRSAFDRLRRMVDVRRDIADGRRTLRNPAHWGRVWLWGAA